MSNNDDTAGPLIGWSLGSGVKKRPLDDLVAFPCRYLFKAVGPADDDFVAAVLTRVAAVIGRPLASDEHSTRPSKKGTYVAVSMRLWVENADRLYAIYAAIKEDERVRYVL